jgi:pimeloyl-ACP methyl ester carboxylesterase
VGVFNTEFRNAEFTPPGMNAGDPKNPKPKADLYGKMLVEEVKPLVDQRYRTAPDRQHTGIVGSAQGGLVTAYLAKAHKDHFGFVGLCSPWLRSPDAATKLLPEYASGNWMKQTKWYVDLGVAGKGAGYPPNIQHETASKPEVPQAAAADVREFVTAFGSAGLVQGTDFFFEEVSGGEFNELAWQKRVEPLLLFASKVIPTPPAPPPTTAPATEPSAAAGN